MSEQAHTTTAAFGSDLLARLGRVSCPDERTFWFVGHDKAEFEAVTDLVEALTARYPRLGVLFTASQPATRAWLRRRHPKAVVQPPPLRLRLAADRYLSNLNVRGLVVLGRLRRRDRVILKAASARAIPAVIVELPAARAQPLSATALGVVPERLEHHFVASAASRGTLLKAGADGERISLLPAEAAARREAFMAVVAHLLGLDLKLIRSGQRPIRRWLEQLSLGAMERPRLRRLLSARVRRFDSIAELRDALGQPRTILCLGNGPSSEDPRLAGIRHDSLFRVNHVWATRGFLTKPDMVFTGSKATLAAVKGPIYGLQSIKSEARLLVTRFLQPPFRRTRYATIERFGLYLSEPRWHGIRPTNGAAMLATAVALRPERLVISGIDLFSHPEGSYPGDTRTPNAYSPGHSADSELALLLEALSLYEGELTILSSALSARWEEFRSTRRPRQDTG